MVDIKLLGQAIALLLFLTSPGIIILICFLMTRRKHPDEDGRNPIYQTTCSVRINGPKHNFVRITLYEDFLLLMTILTHYIIPINALKSAKMDSGIFFGLFAEALFDPHNTEEYPYIVIDSSEAEQVCRKIAQLLKSKKTTM